LDPGFLRANEGGGPQAHMAFLALVVLNLVAGFQVLGTLMVVGLMMLPAASARFWISSVAPQIALAALLGVLASLAGLLVSYYCNAAASPAIILAAGLFYLFSIVLGPCGGLMRGRRRTQRHPINSPFEGG
jgi:zinc/manganese transport system permease protein